MELASEELERAQQRLAALEAEKHDLAVRREAAGASGGGGATAGGGSVISSLEDTLRQVCMAPEVVHCAGAYGCGNL